MTWSSGGSETRAHRCRKRDGYVGSILRWSQEKSFCKVYNECAYIFKQYIEVLNKRGWHLQLQTHLRQARFSLGRKGWKVTLRKADLSGSGRTGDKCHPFISIPSPIWSVVGHSELSVGAALIGVFSRPCYVLSYVLSPLSWVCCQLRGPSLALLTLPGTLLENVATGIYPMVRSWEWILGSSIDVRHLSSSQLEDLPENALSKHGLRSPVPVPPWWPVDGFALSCYGPRSS